MKQCCVHCGVDFGGVPQDVDVERCGVLLQHGPRQQSGLAGQTDLVAPRGGAVRRLAWRDRRGQQEFQIVVHGFLSQQSTKRAGSIFVVSPSQRYARSTPPFATLKSMQVATVSGVMVSAESLFHQ